ncbi:MAG: hypothetical protein JEY94_08105 [Melioribacteraceae bacterium]|nr:hypothetical protein [Melioribacteraceae bacterium]
MKKLLMIGDSITDWFDTDNLLPNFFVKNVGVAGDSTVETLGRIDKSWFDFQPDYIFICIGTNDFARFRKDAVILENIEKIVIKVKTHLSKAKIYITTIFPTRDNKPRPNDRISNFNAQLNKKANSLNAEFFDLHYHFTDEDGKLKSEYTEDGLHLTPKAYVKWAEILTLYLKEE